MDIILLVLVTLVFIAIVIALVKGGWQLLFSGFAQTVQLIRTVWLRLLLGITLGGLIKVLIPASLVLDWLGPASGLRGILIASYAGVLIGGGGPYVALPVFISLLAAGAGISQVIALLAAWNLINLQNLIVWQMPFLGTKLALSQYLVFLFIPPFVGILGNYIYQIIT
ncbi:hypothetical protein ACFLUZ_04930 [Chloroflexota bacterium]